MRGHIQNFVNLLREAGVRISSAEVIDCVSGMEHIDLLDKAQFKALLRTALIKRSEHLEEFEYFFKLCFEIFEFHEEAVASPVEQARLSMQVQAVLEQANGLFSPWFRKLLLQGLPALTAGLLEMGRRAGLPGMRYSLQASRLVQKIRGEFGMGGWPEEAEHLLSRLGEGGVPTDDLARLKQEIGQRVYRFEEMVREHVGRRNEALKRRARSGELNVGLSDKVFGALTPWEIEAMRQTVIALVKKIRDESALRRRRSAKGRFDLKQTLRKSMRYGGVPMEISLKHRKKSKGRIVALCDVSSSVWNASRFMLHLLYSLQDQFEKVRSFVFVDQLGEVTHCFERMEVNEAVEKALKEADIPYNRYTDYGSVFKQFCEEYIDAVNRRTTVIVIGDGRNNFFYPNEHYLSRIRDRARRLIWLNPESRGFWQFGDSMMHRYEKNCDEARECRNLKQLMAFINELTL